jgi:hypothetical protein
MSWQHRYAIALRINTLHRVSYSISSKHPARNHPNAIIISILFSNIRYRIPNRHLKMNRRLDSRAANRNYPLNTRRRLFKGTFNRKNTLGVKLPNRPTVSFKIKMTGNYPKIVIAVLFRDRNDRAINIAAILCFYS